MPENRDAFIVLLNEYLKGNLRPDQVHRLEDEIKSDPQKQLLFDIMQGKRREEPAQDQLEIDYANHRAKLVELGAMDKPKSRIFRLPKFWRAMAASIVFCLSLGVLYHYIFRTNKHASSATEYVVSTERGEKKHITMPDGTEIWLNGESELFYQAGFNTENRDIKLTGEAYFDVSKNKKLPFIVNANGIKIKVVGTAFNVRAYNEEGEIQTSLIEGKIELSTVNKTGSSQSFNMQPGEKITIQKRLTKDDKSKAQLNTASFAEESTVFIRSKIKNDFAQELPSEILWKENTLVLDSDPLNIVGSKLEKWFDKTIVIEQSADNNFKFNGSFNETDIQKVLQILKESGGDFQYETNQDTIRIY
ncbi:FecR family protein [Sphingobacterium shayense]|uniref:FecR family protein n=1 Tax=Sphingobacterium shayense TaxID=626343 RepID=UPI00155666D2|nr:FecR family protein [Sphingobacterium shayense]NQD71297.1 FecR family protein [Sphingobacterium shayense]